MSIIDPTTLYTVKTKRSSAGSEDLGSLIPGPPAAPANLLPFPTAQPLRLYNRNRADEYYGFYTYFDRNIFLTSVNTAKVTLNQDGGSSSQDARYRCTWSQTRFLVQIWTKMNGSALLTGQFTNQTGLGGSSVANLGSFPYPVTVKLDRHGGNPISKMIYCYGMTSTGTINATQKSFVFENRSFRGTLINPATGTLNDNSSAIDGGSGGCSCKWASGTRTSGNDQQPQTPTPVPTKPWPLIAASVAAGSAGLILVVTVTIYFCRFRRRLPKHIEDEPPAADYKPVGGRAELDNMVRINSMHELPAGIVAIELPAPALLRELPGESDTSS